MIVNLSVELDVQEEWWMLEYGIEAMVREDVALYIQTALNSLSDGITEASVDLIKENRHV